jgi:hypothetical protein
VGGGERDRKGGEGNIGIEEKQQKGAGVFRIVNMMI